MGVPASTGKLVTSLDGMKVGDYIACKYVATSTVGTFSEFGSSTATEIPVAGSATPNGLFYFVKIAKGIICSDRVIQHSVTWDVLNAGKVIQGKPQSFGAYAGVIRSLTGGVAYADANGNSSTTDISKGAFPTNNEWDRYIANFNSKLIQSGKTIDDVFHWIAMYTRCQETPILQIVANTSRTIRGNTSLVRFSNTTSSVSTSTSGFRPVFEYQEAK